jgi:kumamolisin
MRLITSRLCASLSKLFFGYLLFVAATASVTLGAQAPSGPAVQLSGHVLRILPAANKLPKLLADANEQLILTVMLHWSDEAGFDAYVQSFDDPKSPNYHHNLSHEEFMARFGPIQQAYDTVLAFLQQNGFTLLHGSSNRLTITVQGTRAQAERAFGVSIDNYQLGSRTFRANSTEPLILSSLGSMIRSVSGFSNLAQPHPSGSPAPANPTSFEIAYNGVLTPAGTGNSGGLPPGINGAGQNIALIEFDNFNPGDLMNTLTASGLPASFANQVTEVGVNGGTTPSEGNGTVEVLLDIVSALGAAQGANIIVVSTYKANATQFDMANVAFNVLITASQGLGGVISDSWYYCESQVSDSDMDSMEGLLQAMKIYGVSFFVATGDFGANCVDTSQSPPVVYPNSIQFPSDAPDAIAVGGTTLQVGAGNSYQSENWWTNAGAYGTSRYFGRPSYQNAYTNSSGRSVPDVVADAGDGIQICKGTPVSCNYAVGCQRITLH